MCGRRVVHRDLFDHGNQVERHGLESHFPRFHFRKVEKIVDDGQECTCGLVHLVQVVRLAWRKKFRVDELKKPEDAVQWGANLVADVREELALRLGRSKRCVAREL